VASGDQQPEQWADAPAGAPTSSTILVVVAGRIERDTIAGLCERVQRSLAASACDRVICDVGALGDVDAATVDALARLQLTAKRLGREFRLRGASDELQALLALAGLRDVLPPHQASVLEVGRQTEQRKQTLGVEERIEPDDPTA
jgi:anti-anti-sigma factor